MTVLRYYAVAAAFGQPPDRLETLVSGTWLALNPETAASGIVSKHYFDGAPRHACLGVSVWEITPEAITEAQKQIAEVEKAGASAVLPFSVVPNTAAQQDVPAEPDVAPSARPLDYGGLRGEFWPHRQSTEDEPA